MSESHHLYMSTSQYPHIAAPQHRIIAAADQLNKCGGVLRQDNSRFVSLPLLFTFFPFATDGRNGETQIAES